MSVTSRDRCRSKRRYAERGYAFFDFILIASDGGWHYGLKAYWCAACNGFHLGHGGTPRVLDHETKAVKKTMNRIIDGIQIQQRKSA